MKNVLKYIFLVVVFFIPVLIFASNENSAVQDRGNSSLISPIKAKNVKINLKRSLPSPSYLGLGGEKTPPSHSNAGGNDNDDGDDTDDTSGEGAITGELDSSGSGDKYAIVIGIADYPGTQYDLKYTDDDAREVVDNLKNVYGYVPENIITLIDEEGSGATEATDENIYSAIEELRSKIDETNDEVVFYFSGHGSSGEADDGDKEVTDESIIVHDGTNLVNLWDGILKKWFSDIGTDRIVFGFDSCLSGGMDDLAADGRIVVSASTETESAYEFDSLENGQFTYYFFEEGIKGGLADTYDHDGDGSLGESIDVVIEEAYEYTKNSYHPRYKKKGPAIFDLFTNDLLLGY